MDLLDKSNSSGISGFLIININELLNLKSNQLFNFEKLVNI